MKFMVESLRPYVNEYGDVYVGGEEQPQPCENAERIEITHKHYYNCLDEFYERKENVWIVEINSLEDLLKIQKEHSQVRIFRDRGLPDGLLRMEIGTHYDERTCRWSY